MPEGLQKLITSYEYSLLFPGLYWDRVDAKKVGDILTWQEEYNDNTYSLRDLFKMGGRQVSELWSSMDRTINDPSVL